MGSWKTFTFPFWDPESLIFRNKHCFNFQRVWNDGMMAWSSGQFDCDMWHVHFLFGIWDPIFYIANVKKPTKNTGGKLKDTKKHHSQGIFFKTSTIFSPPPKSTWDDILYHFFSAQRQKIKISKRPNNERKTILFGSLIPWNLVTPFSNKTHGPWDPWIHRIHRHATRWEFACTLSCSPRWLEGLGGILFPLFPPFPKKRRWSPKCL